MELMPQGLQTFNENGDILLDVSDRVQKYLGAALCPENVNSGVEQNPYLVEGDLWYLIIPDSYPTLNLEGNTQFSYSVPTVTKEGDKLLWSFTTNHVGCRILYGVF